MRSYFVKPVPQKSVIYEWREHVRIVFVCEKVRIGQNNLRREKRCKSLGSSSEYSVDSQISPSENSAANFSDICCMQVNIDVDQSNSSSKHRTPLVLNGASQVLQNCTVTLSIQSKPLEKKSTSRMPFMPQKNALPVLGEYLSCCSRMPFHTHHFSYRYSPTLKHRILLGFWGKVSNPRLVNFNDT